MEDGDKEILVKDQRESGEDSTRWSLWRPRYKDPQTRPLLGKIIFRCVAFVCAAFA